VADKRDKKKKGGGKYIGSTEGKRGGSLQPNGRIVDNGFF